MNAYRKKLELAEERERRKNAEIERLKLQVRQKGEMVESRSRQISEA